MIGFLTNLPNKLLSNLPIESITMIGVLPILVRSSSVPSSYLTGNTYSAHLQQKTLNISVMNN